MLDWTCPVWQISNPHQLVSCQITHYCDVIMGAIASHITNLTIVNSIVYSDADQRKHQSSASLAFVRGIHWGPVSSPHKWPVTRKMFQFDDVIIFVLNPDGYHNYGIIIDWFDVFIMPGLKCLPLITPYSTFTNPRGRPADPEVAVPFHIREHVLADWSRV